jgi:hypothetical protein
MKCSLGYALKCKYQARTVYTPALNETQLQVSAGGAMCAGGSLGCRRAYRPFLTPFPCVLTQVKSGVEHSHNHEDDCSKYIPVKVKNLVQCYVDDPAVPARCHHIWGALAIKEEVDLGYFPATAKNKRRVSE